MRVYIYKYTSHESPRTDYFSTAKSPPPPPPPNKQTKQTHAPYLCGIIYLCAFTPGNVFACDHYTVESRYIAAICVPGSPNIAPLVCRWWRAFRVNSVYQRRTDIYSRADSRLAPSQWETSLQCNAVSPWLGANLKSAMYSNQTMTALLLSWPFRMRSRAIVDCVISKS